MLKRSSIKNKKKIISAHFLKIFHIDRKLDISLNRISITIHKKLQTPISSKYFIYLKLQLIIYYYFNLNLTLNTLSSRILFINSLRVFIRKVPIPSQKISQSKYPVIERILRFSNNQRHVQRRSCHCHFKVCIQFT